jgi:hypothetical protein
MSDRCDWLRDVDARRDHMRAAGLFALIESLVRGGMPAAEAIAILAAEMRARPPAKDLRRLILGDVARVAAWLGPQLARAAETRFRAVAVMLGESEPALELALSRSTSRDTDEWAGAIVARSARSLRGLKSLRALKLPRTEHLSHFGPLAVAALLTRDALLSLDPARATKTRCVHVLYTDGDGLTLPWPPVRP